MSKIHVRVGGGEGERSSIQRATGHSVTAQPCHTFEFYIQTKRWYSASTQDVYWSGQDQWNGTDCLVLFLSCECLQCNSLTLSSHSLSLFFLGNEDAGVHGDVDGEEKERDDILREQVHDCTFSFCFLKFKL